jgi:hypothetical protein
MYQLLLTKEIGPGSTLSDVHTRLGNPTQIWRNADSPIVHHTLCDKEVALDNPNLSLIKIV